MNRNEKIQILKDLINLETLNHNEELAANYLVELFEKHGLTSEKVTFAPRRENFVGTLGTNTTKTLGFCGHLDVVDPGDHEHWTTPPFVASERNGKIFGRGASDNKAGLAALAIAMIELKEENADLNGQIKLLATVSEEIGHYGAKQLTDLGYADNLDGLIIGVPSIKNIQVAHKGSINYFVTSHGKNAHSSMPELGINAINNLMVFFQEVNNYFNDVQVQNPVLGKPVHNVTILSAGNQINSIPEKATLQGNIRTIPELDNDAVLAVLTEMIDKLNERDNFKLELSWTQNKFPVFSDPDSELVKIIEANALKMHGHKLPLTGYPGMTDASEFTRVDKEFPIVIFGPGNSSMHQVDENVDIDDFLDMIDAYKAIAKDFLK